MYRTGQIPSVAAVFAVSVIVAGCSSGNATLMPTPAATTAPASATADPSPSPGVSTPPAPALSETFTSTLHGISLSYPAGWTTQAATEPWTGGAYFFREPAADFLYDPARTDHLFLTIASQPIGGTTHAEWVGEKLKLEECTVTEPFVVDGATGMIGADGCNVAAVTTGGRGYLIWLYTSGDEAWLSATYDRAWFEELLATVKLRPEDAVDVAP